MKSCTAIPCRSNDAVLLVTDYREGALQGVVMHPRLKSPRQVSSIPQMILLLDDLMVWQEGLVSIGSFEPIPPEKLNVLATLHIQVLFREHYTWQGSLLWEEGRKEAPFHSVLELIQILDEILDDLQPGDGQQ